MDSAVFIPMKAAREMAASSEDVSMEIKEGQVSAVLLKFKEGQDPEEAAIRLELEVPGISVELASVAARAARPIP